MARVQASLLALAIVAMAAVFTTASGASYTVGKPRGSWDTQTNLTAWASSIMFKTGDQLVFNYSVAAHDVVEVNSTSYSSCSAVNPIATFRTGNDVVQLGRAVTRYFICSVPGHCAAGMKLQVRIAPTTCRRRRGRRSYVTTNCPPSSSAAAPVSSGRVISSVLAIVVLLLTLGPMM